MPKKIKITTPKKSIDAELTDSKTASLILKALPIEAKVNRWGDEIYFKIPVDSLLDDTAKEVVEMGEIGYWPTGNAFCIFFGPTPISSGNDIVPASAVNIVGKVLGDLNALKEAFDGDKIRLDILDKIEK